MRTSFFFFDNKFLKDTRITDDQTTVPIANLQALVLVLPYLKGHILLGEFYRGNYYKLNFTDGEMEFRDFQLVA